MTIVMYEKVIQLLDENNIDYKERVNSITLKCPVCFKYKLDIHKEHGYFICYHCASQNNVKGKNAAYILAKILDKPYHELNFKLNFFDIDDIDSNFDQPKQKEIVQQKDNTEIVQWPKHFFRINLDIAKPGVEYLNKRGIDLSTAKKHEIRYNPKDYQIVFPVFSNNNLVGYQGRSILPEVPKQFTKFTMPGFQKANFLMFEKTINQNQVIMAEGPVSALKFEKTNIPFVATMGKYVSFNQLKLLSEKQIKKIYLALDRDAFDETVNLIKKYNYLFEFFKIDVPSHRDDFGDCTFDECTEAFNNSYAAYAHNLFPSF